MENIINTYEEMIISLLAPLNIFSFAESSVMESKIYCIANALDTFKTTYEDMYTRRFNENDLSESECDNYLKRLGYYDLFSEKTVAFKNTFCRNYYKNAKNTATYQGMKNFIEGMGLNVNISQPSAFNINILLLGNGIEEDLSKYQKIISDLLPLEVQAVITCVV